VAFLFLEDSMSRAPSSEPFPDVTRLNDDLREYFEERAAIREFDGGLPRDHAECLALLDTLRRDPLALVGVSALEVELEGVTRVVLTTDPGAAVTSLSALGAKVLGTADIPRVIAKFHGIAMLAPFR
jgi:hypothetical protein